MVLESFQQPAGAQRPGGSIRVVSDSRQYQSSPTRIPILGSARVLAFLRAIPGEAEIRRNRLERPVLGVSKNEVPEGGTDTAIVDDQAIDEHRLDLGETGVETDQLLQISGADQSGSILP